MIAALNERRRERRFRPTGVTALVTVPAALSPLVFHVKDMSPSGLRLAVAQPMSKELGPDDVVDVELWGFRRAIRARGLVLRTESGTLTEQDVALKLYAFSNGDEAFYREQIQPEDPEAGV